MKEKFESLFIYTDALYEVFDYRDGSTLNEDERLGLVQAFGDIAERFKEIEKMSESAIAEASHARSITVIRRALNDALAEFMKQHNDLANNNAKLKSSKVKASLLIASAVIAALAEEIYHINLG